MEILGYIGTQQWCPKASKRDIFSYSLGTKGPLEVLIMESVLFPEGWEPWRCWSWRKTCFLWTAIGERPQLPSSRRCLRALEFPFSNKLFKKKIENNLSLLMDSISLLCVYCMLDIVNMMMTWWIPEDHFLEGMSVFESGKGGRSGRDIWIRKEAEGIN